jgi:hypothetical protein
MSEGEYYCGFDSCKERQAFSSLKAAKQHYARFHKEDLEVFQSHNVSVPAIVIKAGARSHKRNSVSKSRIPVVSASVPDDSDEEDDSESMMTEDDEESVAVPRKSTKRKRSQKTVVPKKKVSAAEDDSIPDDPEYQQARKQMEKVKNATLKKKALLNRKEELDKLHHEYQREDKHEEVDEALEFQKQHALYRQETITRETEQLIASTITIVNVVKDAVQRKENINQFVLGTHDTFSPVMEKFDREQFMDYLTGTIAKLNESCEMGENDIKLKKEALKERKNTFTNQFDAFEEDEQFLMDFAENVEGPELRRAMLFSYIYQDILLLNYALTHPRNVAIRILREALQERLELARLAVLSRK